MTVTSSRRATLTLPTDEQILITREFDAPRHLVFRTWTTPELVKRWWHANRGEATLVEIDLRVGGKWRHVMVTPDGTEVGFHGEYLEIVVPERIHHTEIFDPFPDSPALVTMTLEERDGKTHYQTRVVHTTKEARDMHIQSGMEVGAGLSYDQLERVAQSIAAAGSAARAD